MSENSDHHGLTSAAGNPVRRFAWQSGGLALGRGAAFVALVLMARHLGLEVYGRFVVLLAMLELAAAPWKPTVQQAAASRLGRQASHQSWLRAMGFWWLVGAVVLGPIAWWFEGWTAALALVLASAANGLMIEHVPGHILAGRQRRIAIALSANQLVRLAAVVVLIASDVLTPAWAITAHIAGYLVGAALLRAPRAEGEQNMTLLIPDVGVEGLRWIEAHGPVLVVALVLGLDVAGGFDLLFKLATAITEMIAGIGIVVLPDLVGAKEPVPRLVARGIRMPTALSLIVAIGFAVVAGPVLKELTNATIGLGLAPALLAVTLALAPWMGVSKAALIALDGSTWILPSQLATASATLIAFAVANQGVVWAAAAVAVAHVVASIIRWYGMRQKSALPALGEVLSVSGVMSDFRSLARLAGGRS